MIARRQYVDWREFRHRDVYSTEVLKAIEQLCSEIVEALSRPDPEEAEKERHTQEEVEQRRRQQEEEQRQQKDRRQAQEEAQRRSWEEERRQLQEDLRRREEQQREAEARRQAEERRQQQAEEEPRRAQEEAERRRQQEEQVRIRAEEERRRRQQPPPPPEYKEISFSQDWDLLAWARNELRERFGVSSPVSTAREARDQLKRRGYRVRWSYLKGKYEIRAPDVSNR